MLQKRDPEQFKTALKEKLQKEKKISALPLEGQKIDASSLSLFRRHEAVDDSARAALDELVEENKHDLAYNPKTKDSYDLDYDKGRVKKIKKKKAEQKEIRLDFERKGKMTRDKKGNLIRGSSFGPGRFSKQDKVRKGKMKQRYGSKTPN